MKVLAFGEILWDVYSDKSVIGGAPFNFAAHFVKNGGQACLISGVGNDSLSTKTIEEIKNKGVSDKYITVIEKQTGKCLVTLDEDSIPSYNLLNDVAYDYINTENVTSEKGDILYFGTLSLRSEYNFNSLSSLIKREKFEEVFVDVNIRAPFSSEKAVAFAVNNATILKISDEELSFVNKVIFGKDFSLEESIENLADKFKNLKVIIITMGAKGAIGFERSTNKTYKLFGKRVETVSTVGAGDSFSAAFINNYLKTGDMYSSLEFAIRVSAFVATNTEAIPDYDPEEIRIKPYELNKYLTDNDELKLSRLFTSGMVLQANKEIRIFGEGKGEIEVELNGLKGAAQSNGEKWLITLPALNYGGPYELKVKLNSTEKVFEDVWIGDVYLVAGQSNIRYNLRHAGVNPETFEENEQLRIFGTNEEDISAFTFDEGWCSLKKSNAPRFSAVGYYMGLELVGKTDNKVGLIVCSQGAGVLQAFLPKGYLDNTDCFIPDEERSEGYKNPLYVWNKDGNLYNEKFAKMIPFNVKAAIWYQGEGNTTGKDYTIYDKLLEKFIEKWRLDLMDENLPFIIVQLANYKTCSREGWTVLQQKQAQAAEKIDNAYLVKCADICEDDDIHPPTKNLLGKRLADKLTEIFE